MCQEQLQIWNMYTSFYLFPATDIYLYCNSSLNLSVSYWKFLLCALNCLFLPCNHPGSFSTLWNKLRSLLVIFYATQFEIFINIRLVFLFRYRLVFWSLPLSVWTFWIFRGTSFTAFKIPWMSVLLFLNSILTFTYSWKAMYFMYHF